MYRARSGDPSRSDSAYVSSCDSDNVNHEIVLTPTDAGCCTASLFHSIIERTSIRLKSEPRTQILLQTEGRCRLLDLAGNSSAILEA